MNKNKTKKWYYKTWGIILLLFVFFPLGLFFMWKNARWSKKIKWTVTGIFIFSLIVSFNTSGKTSVSPQITETIVQQESFTKDEAMQKVQDYRLQKDFPDVGISKGETILNYYNKRGEIPAVKNEGWYAEETGNKYSYIVGYKATIGSMHSLPKWEITQTSIKAINGAASNITPELGVQQQKKQGNDFEKEVYEYSVNLYKQLEAQAGDSVEKQREAEDKSVSDTAQHFGISEKEVIDIISKLQ